MNGKIPEKITYFYSSPDTSRFRWDDIEDDSLEGVEVWPTFPAASETTKATGRLWARDRGRKKYDVVEEEFDNIPKQYTITSLVHRGNGGRAYKVMDSDFRWFDLREDVLFDIMTGASIENGIINADLIWARVGSQMKLVRVGSKLHDELIKATKEDGIPKVKPKDLEVGRIYTNKKGELLLYLGKVNHFDLEYNCDTLSSHTNKMLVGSLDKKPKSFDSLVSQGFRFQIQNSLTCYDTKKGKLKLPDDYIEQLRKSAEGWLLEQQKVDFSNRSYMGEYWKYNIPRATMVKYPEPLKESDILEEIRNPKLPMIRRSPWQAYGRRW